MFLIQINVNLSIKDCPDTGVACLDFRRAAGLGDYTTPWVRVSVQFTDETLCRKFSEYLDEDANLLILGSGDRPRLPVRSEYHGFPAMPADVILSFLNAASLPGNEGKAEPVETFIRTMIARAAVEQQEREAEAEKKAAEEDAKKAEEKKAQADKKTQEIEAMKQWVRESPIASKRTKMLLEDGFDSWYSEAFADQFNNMNEMTWQIMREAFPEVGEPIAVCSGEKMYDECESVDLEFSGRPTIEQMEALRKVKSIISKRKIPPFISAELMTACYNFEGNVENKKRTEIRITVSLEGPPKMTTSNDFLILSASPA